MITGYAELIDIAGEGLLPSGLSAEFHGDAQKNKQWNAFLRKGSLTTNPPSLTYVDCKIPMLARMFERRLRGYRAIGYGTEETDTNL